MNEKLQSYLDGELPLDALDANERAQAAEYQAILDDAQAMRSVTAPPWIETRVMASLPKQRPARAGLFAWLLSPQLVRVRPASLALAGIAMAVLLFFARSKPSEVPLIVNAPANVHPVVATQPSIIYVQFVLADRGAKSVTVAGDFNSWDTAATPLTDADGDGVWSGLVALRPGSHKYMFVVDGQKWVTDPEADHYIDDGFGMRNAVVTVASPNGRSI